MTDEQHNKYIAYIFIAHGAFQLLMMLFIVAMFSLVFWIEPPPGQPEPPPAFFGIFLGFMFVIQMAFTAPSFVAAFALLKRKSWARLASIIAACLASMSVPVGTAACVYAMWFFFGDRWKFVYPETSHSGNTPSPMRRFSDDPATRDLEIERERDLAYQYREPPDWR